MVWSSSPFWSSNAFPLALCHKAQRFNWRKFFFLGISKQFLLLIHLPTFITTVPALITNLLLTKPTIDPRAILLLGKRIRNRRLHGLILFSSQHWCNHTLWFPLLHEIKVIGCFIFVSPWNLNSVLEFLFNSDGIYKLCDVFLFDWRIWYYFKAISRI